MLINASQLAQTFALTTSDLTSVLVLQCVTVTASLVAKESATSYLLVIPDPG